MKESEFDGKKKLVAYVELIGKVKLLPMVDNYYANDNLAVVLLEKQKENGEEWYEPFCTLTVNIEKLDENKAAIDVNNSPWAEQFIDDNNIGKFTGEYLCSGFCRYPVYEFNKEFLDCYRYEEENDAK